MRYWIIQFEKKKAQHSEKWKKGTAQKPHSVQISAQGSATTEPINKYQEKNITGEVYSYEHNQHHRHQMLSPSLPPRGLHLKTAHNALSC